LAYTQSLGLERFLDRPTRGIATLSLALLWLTLAWRGSGRPEHADRWEEPLLAALLGRPHLPCAHTLRRSLARFSAKGVRAAVEAAYRAELPRRAGRIWASIDSHQTPYWGRGKKARFHRGWSGNHGRALRGYRLFLAIDTDTGQVITFVLADGRTRDTELIALLARHLRRLLGRRLAGVVADCGFTSHASVAALVATKVPFILGFARSKPIKAVLAAIPPQQRRWLDRGGAIDLGACPWDTGLRLLALGARAPTDQRGPWVYVTSLWGSGPQQLIRLYRQRWRVEQAIDELLHGHDLDHLVSYRLHPNRVAVGLRLLARNLAIGQQVRDAGARPDPIREPLAFRAAHVEGLGTFVADRQTLVVTPLRIPTDAHTYALPWANCHVRYVA
jgi:Transposase DDE domain